MIKSVKTTRKPASSYTATTGLVPLLPLDAISNSGARAVFSRGNLGVVDCTTTVIHGYTPFKATPNISLFKALSKYRTHLLGIITTHIYIPDSYYNLYKNMITRRCTTKSHAYPYRFSDVVDNCPGGSKQCCLLVTNSCAW